MQELVWNFLIRHFVEKVSIPRMGEIMKKIGMELQMGFRWYWGTIGGLFTAYF